MAGGTHASFDPASWLLVDPLEREELAAALEVAALVGREGVRRHDVAIDAVEAAVDRLRVRRHEQYHYFQYGCTPFGMLLTRLQLIRIGSAQVVMTRELEQLGRLTPLHRLVASNLAEVADHQRIESTVRTVQKRIRRPNWMDDWSWIALLRWNAAVDLEGMLLGLNAPPAYVFRMWDILFHTFEPVCLLGPVGERYSAPRLVDVPEAGTAPIGTTTGEEFLEGSARVSEMRAIHYGFGFEAMERLMRLRDGPLFYWRTIALAAKELWLAPQDSMVVVLHDLALHQFPDPEVLGGGGVELSWRDCHPGHWFDSAMERLSQRIVPAHLSTNDAYDFLIGALDLPDDGPYRRYQMWSRSLPQVDELLEDRDSITRGDIDSWTDAAPNALERFQVATFKAASRLRAEDVTVFTYEYPEMSDWALERIQAIITPPVVLSTSTLDTFPPISGEPMDHFWILRDMLVRLVLAELASFGQLRRSLVLVRIMTPQYGSGYVRDLVRHSIGGLSEQLAAFVQPLLNGASE